MAGASVGEILSLAGLILVPELAWILVVSGGACLSVLFTIGLMLPLDVSDEPTRVAAVVGLMMTVGYLIMAGMPSLLGAVRDLTGSFTASLWVIVAGALAMLAVSLLASPARLARSAPATRP